MAKTVNIDRRTFLKTGATFGALAAMYPSRAWSQMPTFKMGFLPRVMGGAAIGLDKAGERHGVKIEIVPMPETTEAMIATARGSIHGCNMTDLHVIRALDENLGVVQVSGLAGGWIEFVALSEVPVGYGDFAGLKNYIRERKTRGNPVKIAVPTGSYQHLMLTWQFARHGIDLKDVEVLRVLFLEHPQVLKMKQVDMAVTVSTFSAGAVLDGTAKVFYYPYDAPSGKNQVMLGVNARMAREERGVVQSVVNAVVDVLKTSMAAPDKRLDEQVKFSGLPRPVMQHFLKNIQYDFRMDLADTRGMAKMMAGVGWVKRDLSGEVERAFDYSFLEKTTGLGRRELSAWKWEQKP